MFVTLGIILALFVFIGIVLFHEAGHFFAARATRTKVEEFGIGIPPQAKIIGTDSRGTKYSINWIPLGGFVRLKGEDISDASAEDIDAFASRPYLARALIILAGVTANFILAGLIFSFLFWSGTSPIAFNSQFPTELKSELVPTFEQALESRALLSSGLVLTPIPGSVAERAGILAGDHIIAVDNKAVKTPAEFIAALSVSLTEGAVDDKTGGEIVEKRALVLERKGQNETILLTPEGGKIGAYVGYDIKGVNPNYRIQYPFAQAFSAGFGEMVVQSRLTLELFGSLISKIATPKDSVERSTALESVGGPIAITSMFVDLAKNSAGISVIFAIAGLLSVNLGVFNLLPLPALDGGRFVTTSIVSLLELLRISRKKIRSYEAMIHAFGFLLLLLLSIFIAFHDISKFF